MTHIITVDNLVKKYKKAETAAVDDISFTVNEGELFAFLGPNGAGKTTTISILTTTLTKTSGTIHIAGYDLDTEASKVRREIGVIFQNHSLDLNLTAEENIRLHVGLYGVYPFRPAYAWMPREYKSRVEELAALMGMEKNMFQKTKTLSGGMKRRFEIIRSLMHEPRVLFLDEPTSGLDPLSRRNLWAYLKDFREKKKMTVFLTTHYLEEAESADDVVVIKQGKIIMQGNPDSLKKRLVQKYLAIDAKHRAVLICELNEKKIPYSENETVHISLDDRSAQSVIQSITTPLSHLQVHTPTLEDAYIEIIDDHVERD